ncbi:MAG: ribosome maturation factor RimM [Gammaproteobacteria bacterium]|nr:MAG: ribosome maturation factor RimM [Gammaproteobacteria bacterium]
MVANRNTSSPLIMGRISGPYGVKGWVRVRPYTSNPDALLGYRPWYLNTGSGTWQRREVLEGRLHGKGLVVRLTDCDDRDAAETLAGTEIGIYRSQLPQTEQDEYYWNDLVGMQVVTLDGEVLGTVNYLLETGANDVLVVAGGDRERLIPFIQEQVVASVDLDAGIIRVDWEADY